MGKESLASRGRARSRHREEQPGVCEGPRRGDLRLARSNHEISPFGRNDTTLAQHVAPTRRRSLLPLPPGEGWGEGLSLRAFVVHSTTVNARPCRSVLVRVRPCPARHDGLLIPFTGSAGDSFPSLCGCLSITQTVSRIPLPTPPGGSPVFWHE